jgi:hypothetical protein
LPRIPENVRRYAAQPEPLPGEMRETVVWGAAQIGLGVRMLLGHPVLWKRALKPILAMLAVVVAVGVASYQSHGLWGAIVRSYGLLLGLGTAPAFLFANTYARIAADAHQIMGFGKAEPHLVSLRRRLSQLIRFALVTVIPTLPVVLLLRMVPGIGRPLGVCVAAIWALYFAVVEQLDNARIARPGEPPEPLLMPWFVAWTQSPQLPPVMRQLAARFGRLCARLSRPWVEEIQLTRQHPAASVGFGGAVGLILAIPLVNLLVRPAAVVAGVHFRARTETRD